MDYVRFGRSGLKVSRLCLGMMTYGSSAWRPWVLDEAASRPFVKRAIEHGINFFDTADMYSRGVSEEVVGRALHELGKHRFCLFEVDDRSRKLAQVAFAAIALHFRDACVSKGHLML